jgi:uncharacterized membrane protein required for colicin V production
MGLDLVLAIIILMAAIRGWLQGFVHQTVRIAGVIACVYLADPVRDYLKPHVVSYLSAIPPELLDRLLWWISAAATYAVMVGLATLVIKITRRPEIPGLQRTNRNDQFAGFLLGAVKGLLIAAFMTAGIERYARDRIQSVAWAEEQAKSSLALKWSVQYQPVPKLWSSQPVRHFVNHVTRMGIQPPSEGSRVQPGEDAAVRPPVQTASRPAASEVRKSRVPGEVAKAVEEINAKLDEAKRSPN